MDTKLHYQLSASATNFKFTALPVFLKLGAKYLVEQRHSNSSSSSSSSYMQGALDAIGVVLLEGFPVPFFTFKSEID